VSLICSGDLDGACGSIKVLERRSPANRTSVREVGAITQSPYSDRRAALVSESTTPQSPHDPQNHESWNAVPTTGLSSLCCRNNRARNFHSLDASSSTHWRA
jgi:hypothetical protein